MDSLQVELEISDSKAEVVIGKNKQRLQDFVRDVEKTQPQIKFNIPNQNYIDLEKLEKRALETRKSFENIAKQRLDSGQINGLTKDIVRASERSKQLENDISSIKKELLNPNRKSSIAFLTEELRAAEKEADSLNRKLSALPSSNLETAAGGAKSKTKNGRRRVTDFELTFLELTDDIAPSGFNRPFNTAAKEMFAVNAASVATLATFGAIAAVGYGIVKITETIKENAKRRLGYEEEIASAMNKQILAGKEVAENFQKQRQFAEQDRAFMRSLSNGSIEELRNQRTNLETLQKLTPASVLSGKAYDKDRKPIANEDYQRISGQIQSLDAQLDALSQKKISDQNSTFDQNWENFKKRQESELKFEEDRRKAQEKAAQAFAKSVEEGKKRVEDLGKTYNSVFDNLNAKTNNQNPFVTLFSEADKSLKSLRENTRGLSGELISTFERMEQKASSLKLFETRLNNDLDVFDLRERAYQLRNPKKTDTPSAFSKQFDDFFKGFFSNSPVKDTSINDRLEKQLSIIYGGALNPDEKAIADRKLISLTSSLNPNDITSRIREAAALANEREADRRQNAEKDAKIQRENSLKVQEEIRDELKKLNKVAEKEGIAGIKSILEIVDNTSGGIKVSGASPTNDDTANYYGANSLFGFND